MQSPREILAEVWTSAGGDAAALDGSGCRPGAATAVLVSRRRRGAGSVAAAGLAAANLEAAQRAGADVPSICAMPWSSAAASATCASTANRRRRPGTPSPASTRCATRFVRLHTNFRHHRDNVCKVLNCKPERDEVQAALKQWDGEDFETEAYAGGCVVSIMRSHETGRQRRMPKRWRNCR